MTKNGYRAFTLLELLIVIVIIGLLSTALVPRIVGVQSRARDTARISNMRSVATALEIYALDHNNTFPLAPFWSNTNNLVAAAGGSSQGGTNTTIISNIGQLTGDIGRYLTSLPTDNGNGLVTYQEGSCQSNGNYFSYYTNNIGSMYAITSLKESRKGNTTNCKGEINSREGAYQVVGKGLIYSDLGAGGIPEDIAEYNGIDNPVDRCVSRMTDAEVIELGALIGQPSITKFYLCQSSWINIQNNNNIMAVPIAINKIVGMIGLVINDTSITSLPPLFNLKRLQQVNINRNPKLNNAISIYNLPALTSIYIEDNNIISVSINNLTNLQQLFLQRNKIASFPIIQNSNSLRAIYLNNNRITSLPELNQWPYRQTLQLRDNNITEISRTNCTYLSSKSGFGINMRINGINICS